MSVIPTITRRLCKRCIFYDSYPLLSRSSLLPSPPFSSLKSFSFCPAFHQTPSLLSQSQAQTPDFFTHHWFSTLASAGPFEFPDPETRTRASPEPGLIDLIKRVAQFESEAEAMARLEDSDIELSREIVLSVIWELREEWRLAFLAFKWGEKRGFRDQKVCDLMIWVLCDHRKFNIAWCLIRDMYKSSMDTRKAMLILIDRYAAADDSSKAIRTFQIMEKFRLTPDEEAFHSVLNALCKHGNIEEAEEFMLVNKNLFPPSTDSFNIILNGWCNVSVEVSEAKRVWRKMAEYCITPNAGSYKHMISCFSKVANLFDSLRLFDEMKKRGFDPEVEVYNSLVYVLTRENCFSEALKLLEKMRETGLKPNTGTYNSMIVPLCEAKKLEEARNMLKTMIGTNLSPTIDTFHAFLKAVDFKATVEVLSRMNHSGLSPNGDTFLLLLEKFLELKQPEYALKIWSAMERFEVLVDSRHYSTLVQGLVNFGWLEKARKLYSEMRSKGFLGDPKLEKLLQKPEKGKDGKRTPNSRPVLRSKQTNFRKGSCKRRKGSQQRSGKKEKSNKGVI